MSHAHAQSRAGIAGVALVAVFTIIAAVAVADEPLVQTTVGLEGRVLWRYGGPAVRPVPVDDKASVVVRIAEQAEDAGRTLYDLRFIAQRPGEYDLRAFLRHLDGSEVTDGDAMPVKVGSLLPEDHKGELFDIGTLSPPRFGGYRTALIALAAIWAAPLVYVIVRRVARKRATTTAPPPGPPSLADQLRPLVESAIDGRLSDGGRARLEMLLLAFWRDRLDLASLTHADALVRLRGHPEAGELVQRLEWWLHRPQIGSAEPVNVPALLAPYREAKPMPALAEATT